MNLSSQIKKYRERDHLSQEELAEKIYVSRQTISNWENEKSYPDVHNLLLMSVLFDISLDELVKGDVEIMRKEVELSKWSLWSWCMIICMVLMPLSIAPAVKFFNLTGLIIPLLFAALMMAAAIRLEQFKKLNNLQTYSEILAYVENANADSDKVNHEKKHRLRNTAFMMIGCAVITLVLALISFVLFF